MKEKIFLIGALILFSAFTWAGMAPVPGPGGDNSRYIILARSILLGNGPMLMNFPVPILDNVVPPLYPLFLAFLMRMFGYNVLICNASSFLLMVGALFIFYKLMQKMDIPLRVRVPAFLLALLSPVFLEHSREACTEAAFILFVAAAVYYFSRFENTLRNRFLVLGFAASILAVVTRYAGILLILPLPFILLTKKKYVSLVAASLAGLVMAVYCYFEMMRSFPSGYLGEFVHRGSYLYPSSEFIDAMGFLKRYIYEAIAYTGDVLPDFIFPSFTRIAPHTSLWAVKIAGGAVFLLATAYGFARLWKRSPVKYFLLFPLIYAVVLPAFPTYGIRYVLPAGVLIFMLFIYGVQSLIMRRQAYAAVFIFLFSFSALQVSLADVREIRAGFAPEWKNYYRLLAYLKSAAIPDGVIMCRKPFPAYLLSDHKTIGYPYYVDSEVMFKHILKSEAQYVIVDDIDVAGIRFSRRYLTPVIETHPDYFTRIYALPGPLTEIYRINR